MSFQIRTKLNGIKCTSSEPQHSALRDNENGFVDRRATEQIKQSKTCLLHAGLHTYPCISHSSQQSHLRITAQYSNNHQKTNPTYFYISQHLPYEQIQMYNAVMIFVHILGAPLCLHLTFCPLKQCVFSISIYAFFSLELAQVKLK